jgi:hypothetical protein
MHRLQNQTALLTTTDQRDYQLRLRIVPVIPSLRGQHFAAKPVSLVRVSDKAAIPTGSFREAYGVTEEVAARVCIEEIEEMLQAQKGAHR